MSIYEQLFIDDRLTIEKLNQTTIAYFKRKKRNNKNKV